MRSDQACETHPRADLEYPAAEACLDALVTSQKAAQQVGGRPHGLVGHPVNLPRQHRLLDLHWRYHGNGLGLVRLFHTQPNSTLLCVPLRRG